MRTRIVPWEGPVLEVRENACARGAASSRSASLRPAPGFWSSKASACGRGTFPPIRWRCRSTTIFGFAPRGTFLDDCLNHSCEPNTGFAGNDPVLYALRDIAAGEELAWDYSTSISEKGWSLACLCGPRAAAAWCCRSIICPWNIKSAAADCVALSAQSSAHPK